MGNYLNNNILFNKNHNSNYYKRDENDDPGFLFMVFLAPYNIETEQTGKIKLYRVNSNKKVIDFIRSTFPLHKRKITHVYNAIDGCEIDKFEPFSNVLHRHACIQLIYCYEDEIYQKYKYKQIRYFDDYELRDKYLSQINLLLKNIRDKNVLTKEYLTDCYIIIGDFIKSNFNNNLILIHEGKILSEEKFFSEYGLISKEKDYDIYYLEKTNKKLCENGYIVGNYVIIEKIDGSIYKALNISNLKEYAIKEIKIQSNEYDRIACELNSLTKVNHKFLLNYFELFKVNNCGNGILFRKKFI